MIPVLGSRILSQHYGQPNVRSNPKSMTLVGSRFPLASAGPEEISSMDDVPGLQLNTPIRNYFFHALVKQWEV